MWLNVLRNSCTVPYLFLEILADGVDEVVMTARDDGAAGPLEALVEHVLLVAGGGLVPLVSITRFPSVSRPVFRPVVSGPKSVVLPLLEGPSQ